MGYKIGCGGLSANWIAEACGGKVYTYKDGKIICGFDDNADAEKLRGLCSDTRELIDGEIFIAIHGERFDGHNFIGAAIERGAYAVICDSIPKGTEFGKFILTENTENAFLQIAKNYKKQFSNLNLTVAVTGSVGKTTTKQFIYSVLSAKYNTHKTYANFNNLVGLPITLLQLCDKHEAAVFEMGMNAKGEISRMSMAAEPDIGVITNIGTAHIGMLGSVEAIRDAKMEITHGFGRKSILVRDGDEPLLSEAQGITVSFHNENADVYIHNIHENELGSYFDIIMREKEITSLFIPVIGKHNIFDAAIACAIGDLAGLIDTEIREGLASFENTGSRQRISQHGGITVIDDCYNASPESMKASLGVLESICGKKRAAGESVRSIAVLGSMLELGDQSASLHSSIGVSVAENNTDILFTLGDDARHIASGLPSEGGTECHSFELSDKGKEELCNILRAELTDGDVVLFKASHSVGLHDIIVKIFDDSMPKIAEG